MEQHGYCKETSKNARIEQLVSKLSTACWRRTTSGRAKELAKQGRSERNGMIAFRRICERFGKTAGVGEALKRVSFPVEIL